MKLGEKRHRLTYKRESNKRCGGNKYGYFQCDCGVEKEILISHVKRGNTKSCGCYHREIVGRKDNLQAYTLVYSRYLYRAKKFKLPFEITLNDFVELSQRSCAYCGSRPTRISSTDNKRHQTVYNGMDRVINDLGYTKNNVVPCCTLCNRMKGALSKNEFLHHLKKIINNCACQGTQNDSSSV